ncbi:MAG TPA: CPBP family intramembrane glutamic endopeptidase [Pseudonocardia sp.]|nr:CPBP family intramembrane glutamic endopeptidase [Pseudonocardia sp.]
MTRSPLVDPPPAEPPAGPLAPPADPAARRRARRGLTVYFAALVPLLLVPFAVDAALGTAGVRVVALFSPLLASVVARLVLREGWADVSFRIGGRRGRRGLLLAWLVPFAIQLPVYAIVWATGLAGLDPSAGPLAGLAPEGTPVWLALLLQVVIGATAITVVLSLVSAGEEIGWRGYMLTRMIDAGVPRPVLVHGLVWAVWHVPVFLLAGYAAGGAPPALALALLLTQITAAGFLIARVRLATGSVWTAVVAHGAWNSMIQNVLDPVTTGDDASVWVGESGVLVTVALVVAAVLASRGTWTYVRALPAPSRTSVA